VQINLLISGLGLANGDGFVVPRSRERTRAVGSPACLLVGPVGVRTGVTFFGMVGLFTDDVYHTSKYNTDAIMANTQPEKC